MKYKGVIERFRPYLEENNIEIIVPNVNERLEEEDLSEYIEYIDGVMCGDDKFTRNILSRAKRLKVISKWGTGVDSIDIKACEEFGIKLCNTPNAFTEPVADSVLAYMLCFARKTPWMDKHMKNGVWEKIPGFALREKVLGIIGVGNIGRAVTKRARAFGMRVMGNDIKEVDPEFVSETGIEMVSKDDIFKEVDILSMNCDLNATSRHILDETAFSQMKKQPFVINTARGPLIKEEALIHALKNGVVSGAGLDVFEEEPLPVTSELMKMENVLIAPHNSNSSPNAWERVHQNTISNLLEVLRNE